MPWLTRDPHRLVLFRAGDARVLEEAYRAYAPGLARVLASGFLFSADGQTLRFHGVGGPFELEDLVQETFVRAFGEAGRQAYDGARPFGPWLFAIARNLVIDRWR